MALYAIGDVQGCFTALLRLLDKIGFNHHRDYLWFTGDLVNRGPQSAEVLRFVMGLGDRAACVLGNHDLHCLAVAAGKAKARPGDTLSGLLQAPDSDKLLAWLRYRPLLWHDQTGYVLVHAGLIPQWDLRQAQACASEVEAVLRGAGHTELYAHMYGSVPNLWEDTLTGWDRLRLIVNTFTRLRYCDVRGCIDWQMKGAPGTQPPHLLPWFAVPTRRSQDRTIVFGHWSALGRYCQHRVLGLDSGCVWGRELSAVRLSNKAEEFYSVSCNELTGK